MRPYNRQNELLTHKKMCLKIKKKRSFTQDIPKALDKITIENH